jgi:hypothetical protein
MAARWDELFGDLEAQWDAEVRRELDAEVADRTRRERAAIGLLDRLSAAVGSGEIVVSLVDGSRAAGRVADAGDGWLLLGGPAGSLTASVLIPFAAVVGVTGLGRGVDQGAPGRRFGFGYALRGLSRDRAVVTVVETAGGACTGTIDVVGRDYVEVSQHALDMARRPVHVTGRRVVPVACRVLVRSA